MNDILFQPKKIDGWTPVFEDYPPFYIDVELFIGEINKFVFGKMYITGSNRFCLLTGDNKSYDVDKYIGVYWKIAS